MDVAVIGSGLIGLAIARELALRGHAVTVVDAGAPARAASWAAAGMLAPYTEAVDDAALLSLCVRSLGLYPAFAAALRDESGIDPNLLLDGITVAAFDDAGLRALQARAASLGAGGVTHRVLDAAAMRGLEPSIDRAVLGGLTIEREGQVDNRLLGQALHAACLTRGVRVLADLGPVAIEADARRVRGLRTSRGFLTAPAIVNAAGAWSGHIDGLPPAARPPVFPVKGQMVALHMPHPLVRRVTWVPGAYLVPRPDGRLLVGATVERAGFDVRVTGGAIDGLRSAAGEAFPALRNLDAAEAWAGLRPGSPDGLPYIGRTALEGLYDASGHGRNGVLLTPVTAQAIADLVDGKPCSPDVAAASPLRDRAPALTA
jgi:glycine oxidase